MLLAAHDFFFLLQKIGKKNLDIFFSIYHTSFNIKMQIIISKKTRQNLRSFFWIISSKIHLWWGNHISLQLDFLECTIQGVFCSFLTASFLR